MFCECQDELIYHETNVTYLCPFIMKNYHSDHFIDKLSFKIDFYFMYFKYQEKLLKHESYFDLHKYM